MANTIVEKARKVLANASRKTTDETCRHLPITISTEVAEQNPQFMTLLQKLTTHIDKTGASVTSAKRLESAQAGLKNERQRWLKVNVLKQELDDFLQDHELIDGGSSFAIGVQKAATFAELQDYLACDLQPNSQLSLLGLRKSDLAEKTVLSKVTQKKLAEEIEARLRRKCEILFKYYEVYSDTDRGYYATKLTELPGRVETLKARVDEEEVQLLEEQRRRDNLFWQIFQTRRDTVDLLERLLREHRFEFRQERDKITAENLELHCNVFCNKIKSLEMKLLCDTYRRNILKALKRIRSEQDSRIGQNSQSLWQIQRTLSSYKELDSQFEQLVNEYTKLRSERDNTRWAVEKFKGAEGGEA